MEKLCTHNTHALPRSNKSCNANEESNERQYSPRTSSVTKSYQNCCDDAANNTANTKTASEDYTWAIAVANRPSNEIGVRLASQGPLNSRDDIPKCEWVSRALKSMKKSSPLPRREIKLASTSIRNINGDDSRNFFAIRLNSN